MTLQEYAERLKNMPELVSGSLASDTLLPSGIDMLNQIKQRIYATGKNSDNNNIGDYSKKPMYASQGQFVKGGFIPQGKRNFAGNTIGDKLIPTIRLKKTGVKKNPTKYKAFTLVKPDYTERKTMYLAEGYKELRDVQSLRTDIMNFSYSGKLLASYVAEQRGEEVILGLNTELSAKKRSGLEAKKGTVFSPTQEEVKRFAGMTNFLLARLTRGIIKDGYYVSATVTNEPQSTSN